MGKNKEKHHGWWDRNRHWISDSVLLSSFTSLLDLFWWLQAGSSEDWPEGSWSSTLPNHLLLAPKSYFQLGQSGMRTSLFKCVWRVTQNMSAKWGLSLLLSQSREDHKVTSFSSFPQEGGVVALFKVCRQDTFRCLYPQALRTLASICCVEEGVHQLEKVKAADSWAEVSEPAGLGAWCSHLVLSL